MKILFELNNSMGEGFSRSSFEWSKTIPNWLFVVQKTCMKILGIEDGHANEVQTINLTESNVCTYWSWNKSVNLLAFVLNRKSVYIWDATSNTFNQMKPAHPQPKPKTQKILKTGKDVDIIKWSSLSDTLLICYSTGQLLLYKNKTSWEKFIDNSEGVLSKVVSVECCNHIDCFGCLTETHEILVMTFGGLVRFYMRGGVVQLVRIKFSPEPDKKVSSTTSIDQKNFWLAYQTETKRIYLTEISQRIINDIPTAADLVYDELDEHSTCNLVDFFWLTSSHLIVCQSVGAVKSLQIKLNQEDSELMIEQALDMNKDDEQNVGSNVFRSFTLRTFLKNSGASTTQKAVSFIAVCNNQIYYYEIFQTRGSKLEHVFEKVDYLDLRESFSKIHVELESVELSCDSSMLALQLDNGHLLVYQSRLQDLMLAKHAGKIAYLSSPSEVTVLNYASTTDTHDQGESVDNAQTFSINFRPSVISVGPKHLAIALNNRIRFYLLDSSIRKKIDQESSTTHALVEERDCISMVNGMSLNSRFVVVQFDDNRLKLHPLKTRLTSDEDMSLSSSTSDVELNERFFPDPCKVEKILSCILTEQVLIYSTQQLEIVVFSLDYWSTWKICDCSKFHMTKPIYKLISNIMENKFVCLPVQERADSSDGVFVYDLSRNFMIRVLDKCHFSLISKQQSTIYSNSKGVITSLDDPWSKTQTKSMKLNQVNDAVWDTDGKTLLLIEPKQIIVLASLDHTLNETDFGIEFVGVSRKCLSYNVLNSSQGIVSFQTSLGRVINSVLDSHDDELKLTRLEQEITSIISVVSNEDSFKQQTDIMNIKLAYLRSILPIYSLTKCKQICQFLMEEEMLNYPKQDRHLEIDDALWKHLAGWSLYTMQLNFALTIYRKCGLLLQSQVLTDIIRDMRSNGFDTKSSLKTRLYVLLGCEL